MCFKEVKSHYLKKKRKGKKRKEVMPCKIAFDSLNRLDSRCNVPERKTRWPPANV